MFVYKITGVALTEHTKHYGIGSYTLIARTL